MEPSPAFSFPLDQILRQFRAGSIDKYEFSRRMHRCHLGLFEYSRAIENTQIQEVQITREGVFLATRDGLRFPLDEQDQYVPSVQLLNFGDYEALERGLIFQILEPGMTCFDIGANIGWYSLVIARKLPDCRVVAFEPIADTYRKLQRNIALNALGNITALQCGLAETEGEQTFYVAPEISGAASGADILGWKSVQAQRCHVRTLDAVRKEMGVCVDFVKCDVEGAELFVFKGARACLSEDKPVVFCEMLRKWSAKFNYHPNEIIGLFAAEGYQCHAVGRQGLERIDRMEETTEPTNFVFLHPQSHAKTVEKLRRAGMMGGGVG